jgi:Holliday junction resolvasome RuvABC ATP-dependent DNA helicase subunit
MIDKRRSNAEEAVQSNIWQDILREAMTKKDLEESHIFVFGDKFVGKHSLVKIINKELLQKNEYEGYIFLIR